MSVNVNTENRNIKIKKRAEEIADELTKKMKEVDDDGEDSGGSLKGFLERFGKEDLAIVLENITKAIYPLVLHHTVMSLSPNKWVGIKRDRDTVLGGVSGEDCVKSVAPVVLASSTIAARIAAEEVSRHLEKKINDVTGADLVVSVSMKK